MAHKTTASGTPGKYRALCSCGWCSETLFRTSREAVHSGAAHRTACTRKEIRTLKAQARMDQLRTTPLPQPRPSSD